jgi:hypothetical protein
VLSDDQSDSDEGSDEDIMYDDEEDDEEEYNEDEGYDLRDVSSDVEVAIEDLDMLEEPEYSQDDSQ